MNYISVDILEKYNCCQDQVDLFKELFPTGIVEFNSLREAELLAKKYSSKFYFYYLGRDVFGANYEEARKPHWDTCVEATKSHGDAYVEATKPHWDAYIEAIDPHLDAYEEAIKPHLEAYQDKIKICGRYNPRNAEVYEEARKPLWDAYEEAKKPLWDAYKEAEEPLWGTYQESIGVCSNTYRLSQAQVFAKMWFELEGE